MAIIVPIGDAVPVIHPTAWVAPNATLVGNVTIGAHSSVFYGCVLRADINEIRVGERSNIQDNSVLHVDGDAPCIIGDDVTIGHLSLVHGTTVEDRCLIGMHSTLLSQSVIKSGSLVAAGAVVKEHQVVDEDTLVAGVPAKPRKKLESREAFAEHAARYVRTSQLQEPPLPRQP